MRPRPAFHSHAGALLHDIFPTIPNRYLNKNVQANPQYEHNNTKLNSPAFLSLELDSTDQDLPDT